MIPRPAQYLLRFDDFCPTMSRAGWERFEPLLEEFAIRPILAVVPENMDPELMVSEPDAEFWNRMRRSEESGATIAMHGYRHVCLSRGTGLIALHRETEFAGATEDQQREWIHAGLEILRGHGLNPKLWVAPRHGFDEVTIGVLRDAGISFLSDGFARAPFWRGGITWIPQQLWGPEWKSKGLWTICIHSNTATEPLVRRLRDFLRENRDQFTSFERVAIEFELRELGRFERAFGDATLVRKRVSKRLRHLVGPEA